MKRVILFAMIVVGLAMNSLAQTDLKINEVFGGKYASDPNVSETMVNGPNRFLRNNRLTNFATFKGDAKTYAPILQPLVLADGSQSIGRNVRYKDGILQFAYFQLRPKVYGGRKLNRFLYYVCNPKSNPPTVMLIYFDGSLSRMQADGLIKRLSK